MCGDWPWRHAAKVLSSQIHFSLGNRCGQITSWGNENINIAFGRENPNLELSVEKKKIEN